MPSFLLQARRHDVVNKMLEMAHVAARDIVYDLGCGDGRIVITAASVVTLYLVTELNLKLRPRLMKECRPGTRIVSHAFAVGNWKPERTDEVNGTTVYLRRIPPRKA